MFFNYVRHVGPVECRAAATFVYSETIRVENQQWSLRWEKGSTWLKRAATLNEISISCFVVFLPAHYTTAYQHNPKANATVLNHDAGCVYC